MCTYLVISDLLVFRGFRTSALWIVYTAYLEKHYQVYDGVEQTQAERYYNF